MQGTPDEFLESTNQKVARSWSATSTQPALSRPESRMDTALQAGNHRRDPDPRHRWLFVLGTMWLKGRRSRQART